MQTSKRLFDTPTVVCNKTWENILVDINIMWRKFWASIHLSAHSLIHQFLWGSPYEHIHTYTDIFLLSFSKLSWFYLGQNYKIRKSKALKLKCIV